MLEATSFGMLAVHHETPDLLRKRMQTPGRRLWPTKSTNKSTIGRSSGAFGAPVAVDQETTPAAGGVVLAEGMGQAQGFPRTTYSLTHQHEKHGLSWTTFLGKNMLPGWLGISARKTVFTVTWMGNCIYSLVQWTLKSSRLQAAEELKRNNRA